MKVNDILSETTHSEDQLHNMARGLTAPDMATLLAYWYLEEAQRHMQNKVRRSPQHYTKQDEHDVPLTCGPDDVADVATSMASKDIRNYDLLTRVENLISHLKGGYGCEV